MAEQPEPELGFNHGPVEMKGGQVKKYNIKWVIVKRGILQYFNTDKMPKPGEKQLDTLRLRGCSIRRAEKKETKRENSLCLTYPKEKKTKDIYFAFPNDQEVAKWLRAFHESITYANPRLFGIDLRLAVFKTPDAIPVIVGMCLNHLARFFEVEGLFRVPGTAADINALKMQFDKGDKPPDLNLCPDPHVVAALLKLYFRELPNPLCTFNLYSHFLEASKSSSTREQVQRVQQLLVAMPVDHRNTLQVLMKFLRDVSEHSAKNKMSPPNLAAVFGPTILRPQQVSAADAGNNDNIVTITATMICHWEACYGIKDLATVPDGSGSAAAPAAGEPPATPAASAKPVAAAGAAAAAAPVAASAAPAAAAAPEVADPVDAAVEPAPAAADKPKAKWKEYKTKEGKLYYYDSVSKKTQWTRPAEMDEDAPPPPKPHHVGPQFKLADPTKVQLRKRDPPPAANKAAVGAPPAQNSGPPPGGRVQPPAHLRGPGRPNAVRKTVAPPSVGTQPMNTSGRAPMPGASRGGQPMMGPGRGAGRGMPRGNSRGGPPARVGGGAAPGAGGGTGAEDARLKALEDQLTQLERKQDETAATLSRILEALGS